MNELFIPIKNGNIMKNYRDTIISLVEDLQKSEEGKVIFTFLNSETNGHRTFKISKSDFAEGKLVLGLLTGGDNDFAYTNFGFLDPFPGIVTVWRKFSHIPNYEKYGRIIESLFKNKMSQKLSVQHSGKCFKCGRTLTTPDSIESGIGPICAEG